MIAGFVLSKQEGIDRIYLSDIMRRPLIAPQTAQELKSKPLPDEDMQALLRAAVGGEPGPSEESNWRPFLMKKKHIIFLVQGFACCSKISKILT